MKKKLLAGAITLLSVATLAACSKGSEGADLISMKGDVITEHQFYEQVKSNPSAQQVLLNMTIQKVFEKQYGSEVSDKEVEEAVAEEQKKYGDSYQIVLSRSGMTAESRKAQIRTSKLVEYAVKKAAEAELTDENYKKAYDEYTPEVTAQVIKLVLNPSSGANLIGSCTLASKWIAYVTHAPGPSAAASNAHTTHA